MRGIKISTIQLFAFVVFFTSTLLLISTPKSHAAFSDTISYINIEGTIQKDGTLIVNQTFNFTQPSSMRWPIHLRDVRDLVVTSDNNEVSRKNYRLVTVQNQKVLSVDENITALVWKISFRTGNIIQLTGDKEYLRWQIVSSPDMNINSIDIKITSPYPFEKENGSRAITWHGVTSYSTKAIDDKTILYAGSGLGPKSGFTIYTYWPRDTFKFNFIKRIFLNLSAMEITFWLVFGLLLPILAIFLMSAMYMKKRHQAHYDPSIEKSSRPPSDTSPLLVGVLFDMKIYPHTMISTILDLCQRGYLVIVKEKNNYAFGRRKKLDDNLRDWEQTLLEELFALNTVWAKEGDIHKHSKEQLFSPKIREIFDQSYDNITNLGYFDENPHTVRVKYKIFGLFLYLLSIIGTTWTAFSMQPAYLLIPNIGVFLAAYSIFRLSKYMPIQNERGVAEMYKWEKFKNYLRDNTSLGASASVGGIFYEYLPYAIALKVDKQWIERFRSYHLVLPEWYMSAAYDISTEHTISHIVAMIDNLSHALNQLKGPSVH